MPEDDNLVSKTQPSVMPAKTSVNDEHKPG